jgi:hypothetical protein
MDTEDQRPQGLDVASMLTQIAAAQSEMQSRQLAQIDELNKKVLELQNQQARQQSQNSQTIVTQTISKSEKTPDVPPFSGVGNKVVDELENFTVALRLKFRINADRFPTAESRINYVFARTTERAAAIIQAKVDASDYSDWKQVIEDLQAALGNPDPKFSASKRLLAMRQTHHSFAEFFPEFRLVAAKTPFEGDSLKQILRVAISRELTEKLTMTDVRHLSYKDFVAECQRQDNLLRLSAIQTQKRFTSSGTRSSWNATTPQPSLAPATTSTTSSLLPPPDPMDLSRQRGPISAEERARREQQRLCFRCGQPGHQVASCPLPGTRQLKVRALDGSIATPVEPSTTPDAQMGHSENV